MVLGAIDHAGRRGYVDDGARPPMVRLVASKQDRQEPCCHEIMSGRIGTIQSAPLFECGVFRFEKAALHLFSGLTAGTMSSAPDTSIVN